MKSSDIEYLKTLHRAGFVIRLPSNPASSSPQLHHVDYVHYLPLEADPDWLASLSLNDVRVYQMLDMTDELFGLHEKALCCAQEY